MTRPKADSDPWLTDPISRDRVIAKTTVEGIRTIISLLRGIRDEIDESRALRQEVREMRKEMVGLTSALLSANIPLPERARGYEACPASGCALPSGHSDPHRPSTRDAARFA